MTLAALEATLRLFLAPDLLCRRHPTLRMLLRPLLEIERQARELRDRIAAARPGWTVTVVEEASYLGGGALPATPLPTWAVRLTSPAHPPQELARRLRLAEPSVIARIRDEALLLDMRTVQASEVEELARAVAALIEP
jgi:L-seryl-tRNA(Ser) seleniumtransferase